MKTLDYLEKIDDTLAHWEDYFHVQEGIDVTEARANLDKIRKQLLIQRVVFNEELKAFAEYAQKRMWEDGDKDLSEFMDEFLSL
jgi:hypothetical protein